MAYEVVMSYHLHMPSYFLGTFTEYPYLIFGVHFILIIFLKIFAFYVLGQFIKFSTLGSMISPRCNSTNPFVCIVLRAFDTPVRVSLMI